MRLQRRNDFYTFFISPNGTNWTEISSQRNGFQPLLIGLVAGQNNSNRSRRLLRGTDGSLAGRDEI